MDHLWDESHQLSTRQQRTDIERRLATASRHLGSPIFVLVVGRLRHETAAALGARVFAERALADREGSNPVLLVISIADRAAAIETGKGNAGIVPEIDARRITKSLSSDLSHGLIGQALPHAIAAIVDSAEATAERRRPLPRDEDPAPARPAEPGDAQPDGGAPDDDGVPGDGGLDAALSESSGHPEGDEPKGKRHGRSRIPIAAIIAGLLLLALAIRRRRNLAATREDRPAPPRPPRPPGSRRE